MGVKKMGHAGTLDPLATGLMIIGVGKGGTRVLNEFSGLDKVYTAVAKLGERTTTGDEEGEVLERKTVEIDSKDAKEATLNLKGEQNLPVPLYSAIKKKGKPLYWYARRGLPVDIPLKKMVVKEIDFEGMYKENGITFIGFRVNVSAGTYIRSLVEELGRKLGVPATTSAIRRLNIGCHSVNEAGSLEDIEAGKVVFDLEF